MGLIWGNTVIKKIICYKASGYIIQAIGLFAKRHGASGSDFELAQNWRWWELTTKWWSYTTKPKNSLPEKYEKNMPLDVELWDCTIDYLATMIKLELCM